MIIVLWKLSLEDLKMRCYMDVKKITARLMNFQKLLGNISITTTMKGFGQKQNGCLLSNTGKHP